MEYNEEGILNLRDAIVQQVAKDYITTKKYILKHPNKPCTAQKSELEIITRWFYSNKFEDLKTGCSGDYFIRKLDEMVEEDLKPTRKRLPNNNTTIRIGLK